MEKGKGQVYTTHGIVDGEQLEVRDVVTWENGARVTATEWYMGGELVRRDVNVNILVGHLVGAAQANI